MRSKYIMMLKILATTVIGIIGGSMLIPLMTLRLKEFGYSESAIGIWSSLSWVGLLISSPYVARVSQYFGYRKTYIYTGIASLFYVCGIYYFQNYYVWCVLQFMVGFIWAIRWVTTESFINAIAPDNKRGKFIGIYGSLVWVALALGPALLPLTGTAGDLPFYAAIGFFVISFFLNFLVSDVKEVYDPKSKTKLTIWKFFKKHKFIFFVSLIGGIFENGVTAVSILYALSIGAAAQTAALIGACIGIGALLMQYPTGWIADKYKTQNHYLILSLVLLAGNTLLFFAHLYYPAVFVSAFIWGIFGPAVYVLMASHLGNVYKKNDLVAVTSFIIFGYTLGGIFAPIIGGISMDIVPVFGFPVFLLILTMVILMQSALSGKKYR